jgi:hypothetical protein
VDLKMGVSNSQQVAVTVVGSSTFGRYPKISLEKTFNMFISDEWLVNYAGFQKQIDILSGGQGRGLFNSIRGGFLIIVILSTVYKLEINLTPLIVGIINSEEGAVSIDENLSSQICIVDGEDAYIYNYVDNTFTQQSLTFNSSAILPNYVCYHNTFFLIASSPESLNPQNWYAFQFATNSTISVNTQFAIQTKPDVALAVKRLPGHGNNVLVMGSTVCEVWTNTGGLQNYSRIQSFNIDNGLVSVPTLAANDKYICWLSQNESNSPSIMITDGSDSGTQRLSTDGIDFILSEIIYPQQSSAFFYRQDGHLFYQITFYNPVDNLSLIYDFTTAKFFHVCDENLNFHPARQIVFFQENIYFISINDGSLYIMDTNLLTYNYSTDPNSVGAEIPRIRICNTIRKPNSERFRVGEFTFTLEQGVNDYLLPVPLGANGPRIDLSFSKDGNQSFSNIVSRHLNISGKYRNIIKWERLGQANDFTIQLRFWGFNRWIISNGIASIY